MEHNAAMEKCKEEFEAAGGDTFEAAIDVVARARRAYIRSNRRKTHANVEPSFG